MLSKLEIETVIVNYENTRELIDLIRTMQEESDILKAAVANLMDADFGSTRGWTEQREVVAVSARYQVSPEMSRVILGVCDEVRESNNFDPI